MPKVDFVITTRNLVLASRAIASIQESCAEYLGSVIIVMRPEIGFTMGAEQGWRAAREDYVCFVNDDAFVTGLALSRMFQELGRPGVGAVGPCVPCRTHQGQALRAEQPLAVEVPYLVSVCLLVKREALEKIGGWDTNYVLYACDLDLSFRIREAGYKLVWVQDAWVNHIKAASESLLPEEKRKELSDNDHQLLQEKFPRWQDRCQMVASGPLNERAKPPYDGFAKARYERAKARMNGANSVLDLGCAYGTGAGVFTDMRYVGVEIDGDCIDWANRHMKALNTHAEFYEGRVDEPWDSRRDIPRTEGYDAICAMEVIEHVERPEIMLRNAGGAMKDGATLFVSTPNRAGLWNPHHRQEWTRDELEELLLKHFQDVTVEVVPPGTIGGMQEALWAECRQPR